MVGFQVRNLLFPEVRAVSFRECNDSHVITRHQHHHGFMLTSQGKDPKKAVTSLATSLKNLSQAGPAPIPSSWSSLPPWVDNPLHPSWQWRCPGVDERFGDPGSRILATSASLQKKTRKAEDTCRWYEIMQSPNIWEDKLKEVNNANGVMEAKSCRLQ